MEAQKRYERWVLTPDDVMYPLRAADGALHGTLRVIGDLTAVTDAMLAAVVGTRRETPYGAAVSEMVGRTAAYLGITLVCDQATGCAHDAARAALEAGGRVVLVAGCGADVEYPKSVLGVRDAALSRGGAVVSLEDWGAPPARHSFSRKIGLAPALAPVTIVAQAGVPSAAFTAAEMASEMGRNLLASGRARAVTTERDLASQLCCHFRLDATKALTGGLGELVESSAVAEGRHGDPSHAGTVRHGR